MDEHDIPLDEIAEPEDCVPVGAAEESNDDGIESFAGTDFVDELYTNDGEPDISKINKYIILTYCYVFIIMA